MVMTRTCLSVQSLNEYFFIASDSEVVPDVLNCQC